MVTTKNTTFKVYKNGFLVGTNIDGHEPNVMTRANHIIGAAHEKNGMNYFFDGTIAYMKIWHGVELTGSDVDALYFCPSGTFGKPFTFCTTCPVGQYSTYPDTVFCSICPTGKTTKVNTDPSKVRVCESQSV